MNARALTRLTLLTVLLLLVLVGCKKRKKPFPPAPQLSTATTEGAALAPRDAGTTQPVAVTAVVAPADAVAPADRAAITQVTDSNRELEALVKRGAFTNPDRPGEGDANAQCSAVETPRSRLEALSDPEVKKLVTESQRLCSLEVPLLSADRTLKQVTISPSQASRQLMCKYASKDLDKARAANRNDRRLRDLDARWGRACR